ncbi:ParB/RepB/Spo0J family partition protein [Streptomyces sp. NPDC014006]|uniref:ParB/RepB/Spo0J family partition protein n=1 Tax=Streptomyces sp. NPDC014006 TaxID=3364870 RepID=UPI0036FB9185
MSKAKALGTGRFGSTAAPVSARRQAVAAATGVPTDGVAPPTKLPVDRISTNPDNPRSSLGDLTELAGSLLEHGQKQAITVMNRDAYLKANPAREGELEAHTTHVVIDGSSRLAAAREAGLTHVKVWVDDEQGQDSESLLESALVANIHRQDLAELDEARALQRLLAIHGSQTALANRLHKSQGWVSQRLALLNLTPELQEKIGSEPIKLLRAVGNKPPEQQAAALEELKQQQVGKEARKPATKQEAPAEAATTTAAPARAGSHPAPDHYPVIAQAPEPTVAALQPRADRSEENRSLPAQVAPEAPGEQSADRLPKRFPYDDGVSAAQYLIHKMPADEFDTMLSLLIKHRDSRVTATG